MDRPRVLIDRQRGGFGDLMMMSRAFKHLVDEGCTIDLVLEQRFWPLFRRWSHLKTVTEPDGPYDYEYKLYSPCPAAMIENRWVTHNRNAFESTCVIPGRVEIFANALGVCLPRQEKIPFVIINDEDRKAALKIHGRIPRPWAYVQADTNEVYRTWRHFDRFCLLAKQAGISIISYGIENARLVDRRADGTNILTACALIEAADIVVSADSMAMHAAAAFDRPCVAVFGPIGAETRASLYPRCVTVTATGFECMPCWRSLTKCQVTNADNSACLDTVDPNEVLSAAKKVLGIREPLLTRRTTVERSQ